MDDESKDTPASESADDSKSKETPASESADDSASKRGPKRRDLPTHIRAAVDNGARDFVELSDAQGVADAIGGWVEHRGVAFHVVDPE